MDDQFKNIPDVSFIEDLTLEKLQNQMINDFTTKYKEITGNDMEMSLANPYRLILYACTLQQYQMYQYIEHFAKMNLLKYSSGAFLDNIAAIPGIYRNKGKSSITTLRFSINDAMESAITIPSGTRVSGNDVCFETIEFGEIKRGELYVDIPAKCTDIGDKGNGYLPGEITQLVDCIPYLDNVTNITETSGGEGEESDEHFAERIYLAPSSYSVAGPSDAYKYFVKECNPLTSDVDVTSPSPMEVEIRFVLKRGELPSDDMIKQVEEYLSAKNRRPLTDHVTVMAPEVEEYNLNVTYFIAESQKAVAQSIQNNVDKAVEEYLDWQDSKIGRDIDPDTLIQLMKEAGVKRLVINEPVFTKVSNGKIPHISTKTLVYGGIEDD